MTSEGSLDEGRLFHEVTRVVEEFESIHRRTVLDLAASRSELAAARAELAESTWMLSTVAHDLGTPLTAILGFAELLERQDLTEPQHSLNRHVISAARAAHAFSHDLVDVAVAPGAPVPEVDVDLWTVAARVLTRLELAAQQAGVHVALEPGHEPGRFVVPGAEVRLERLVENLVANAVKFSPEGGRVTLVLLAAPDGVELRVQDSGPGIAADQLEQIFAPFHRAPEAAGVPGHGLGLMIVSRIARSHQGHVHAESVPGAGSTFVVRLPRDAAAHATAVRST